MSVSFNMNSYKFARLVKPTVHQLLIPTNLHQKRCLSIFNKALIASPSNRQMEQDLDRAIKLVQKYDPVGYLPGLLVTNQARLGYFAGKCTVSFNVTCDKSIIYL